MKFWHFTNISADVAELRIEGEIIDDEYAWLYEWLEEAYTSPNQFRQQLKEHDGKELRVFVDTYGGSVFAAASIYSDLKARPGKTIGIVHSKAISAGTLILMGCDDIKVSPAATLMIHDPLTEIYGNISDFEKALEILNTLKDTILNAYELKTRQSRQVLSELMTAETWMDANKAVELGFADEIIDFGVTEVQNQFKGRLRVVNTANNRDDLQKYLALNKQKQIETRQKELALYLNTI